MVDTVMSAEEKLLNKKKKRSENLKEAEESNRTISDTNETTQTKKSNKKRKDETKNLDIQKKNNSNSIYPRLNRFMSKEKYIKLNEENSINKKGKKKQKKKKENSPKSQNKIYNKKIYSMNAKNNSKGIKKRNFRRKRSLGGFIGRLMKKKGDKNKKKLENLKAEIESEFSKIINSQNEKIAAQDKKIAAQDKKIAAQDKKIASQDKKIAAQDETIAAQDETIAAQDETINEQKNEIISANNKIAILSEIQNQSSILSNRMNKYLIKLGTGFNSLFNSCKVLYIRKVCDFILDGLINKYQNSMALTRYNFQNDAGTIFPLIVFKNDLHKISKYHLNLLIDYLMETKQNCSAIVHMNRIDDKAILPIMKEVFYVLLNKSPKNSNGFSLDIVDMTGILLEDNRANDEEITDLEEKSNEESEEEREEGEEGEEEGEEGEEEINQSDNEANKISDENSSCESEDEQIKKLLSGKINNIQINDLKRMLIEKRKDKEKGIKDIAFKNKQIINSSFFYNLWIKSFTKEEYKSSKNYKIFIQKNYIVPQKDMINMLNRLLSKYKINFFDENPSKFSQKITIKISRY